MSEVIEPNGGIHVAAVNPLAENLGRAIVQVSHVMPGNIEGGDLLFHILGKGVKEGRIASSRFFHAASIMQPLVV